MSTRRPVFGDTREQRAAQDQQHEHRPLRLLAVHAHPDDETLWNGIALAHHAALGDDVHVVTCTLGEEGEVIPAELAHLEGQGEALARHRREELRRATATLGVRSSILGVGPAAASATGRLSRWRDSGMAGTSAAEHPDAFAGAPLAEPAAALAEVILAERPDAVVTYEDQGGYGHPDHIRAHEVTVAALTRAHSVDPTLTTRLYLTVVPRSWAQEDRAWLAEHASGDQEVGRGGPAAVVVLGPDDPYPPSVVPDEEAPLRIVDPAVLPVVRAAIAEHPTQVLLHDGYYTLSNHVATRMSGREAFVEMPIPLSVRRHEEDDESRTVGGQQSRGLPHDHGA